MNDVEWSEEWPTEPGYYWFFGHRCRAAQDRGDDLPEMIHVRAKPRPGNNDFFYIADGELFWKSQVGDGVWTPSPVPNVPRMEKL